ncbi:hypothetical protein SASPL_101376 [Salvia splendens]|uniref:RING-type E3 ubiquitin transferase n=1 Tax=Salvia splendens TaxID=180675 RepID=A0A8X8YPY0_SALSN|nr:hypothetical protein SASPL_101376 [Salvia splendens]
MFFIKDYARLLRITKSMHASDRVLMPFLLYIEIVELQSMSFRFPYEKAWNDILAPLTPHIGCIDRNPVNNIFGNIMIPGGTFEGIIEGHSADNDVAHEIIEYRNISAFNGPKRGITSNTVHKLLECPVCVNVMFPPNSPVRLGNSVLKVKSGSSYGDDSLQLRGDGWLWFGEFCLLDGRFMILVECPNGHTLSSKCQSKVQCYPICHLERGNVRWLALERVAESRELPRKYQILGCQDIFLYHGRLRHEQNCRYRPYKCSYAGADCPISDSIQFLVDHLKRDHNVDMHGGCTFNHRYVKSNPQDVENATWMLTVFNCYGYQFCLHFEAFNLGMVPVYMHGVHPFHGK